MICPNSDKIYLTIVTFLFLLLFNDKCDSSFPSGSWIVLFWLPAETLSLKRLLAMLYLGIDCLKMLYLGIDCWKHSRPQQTHLCGVSVEMWLWAFCNLWLWARLCGVCERCDCGRFAIWNCAHVDDKNVIVGAQQKCVSGLVWICDCGLFVALVWLQAFFNLIDNYFGLDKNSIQMDNFGPRTHRHTDTLLIFIPIEAVRGFACMRSLC